MAKIHINKTILLFSFWDFFQLDTCFQRDLLFIISRIQNSVWKLVPYFHYFEQICIWQVWKTRIHPMVWVFIVQIYLCYWSASHPFSVTGGKAKGKISQKGRWRIKLQLLWLFWLEMSECWSERRDVPAAFWLHPFCQLLENWVLQNCWILIFHLW